MTPTSVVCFKWRARRGPDRFDAHSVNVLRSMLARHFARPHRFICVTDDAAGLDREVEVVELWNELADLANPLGGHFPSCYRRLKLFQDDAAERFGERFVALDLDAVVTSDITRLLDRDDDFVA